MPSISSSSSLQRQFGLVVRGMMNYTFYQAWAACRAFQQQPAEAVWISGKSYDICSYYQAKVACQAFLVAAACRGSLDKWWGVWWIAPFTKREQHAEHFSSSLQRQFGLVVRGMMNHTFYQAWAACWAFQQQPAEVVWISGEGYDELHLLPSVSSMPSISAAACRGSLD